MALPLPLRNRLAELILDAMHDPDAREGLASLAAVCADPGALEGGRMPERFPSDLFERGPRGLTVRSGFAAHARELEERARIGWDVVRGRTLATAELSRADALEAAAALFDAGLFFEVHELLEPHWFRAAGAEREALQGLIQVAVGFQHLANSNRRGGLALLHDGAAKLVTGRLPGLPLEEFAAQVRARGEALADGPQPRNDGRPTPSFPRATA